MNTYNCFPRFSLTQLLTDFIEMQDLLYDFTNPCVMDIKMGTRTFLESEVSNTKARKDLYEKVSSFTIYLLTNALKIPVNLICVMFSRSLRG